MYMQTLQIIIEVRKTASSLLPVNWYFSSSDEIIFTSRCDKRIKIMHCQLCCNIYGFNNLADKHLAYLDIWQNMMVGLLHCNTDLNINKGKCSKVCQLCKAF